MHSARTLLYFQIALIALLSGCSIGPAIWTAEATEEIRIDPVGLDLLTVETHNGAIEHAAAADPGILAIATKRGGGATAADAQAALEAIEVYVEPLGTNGKLIAWRWRTPRRTSWGAVVAFRITAPAKLSLDALTHNGAIIVRGVAADVTLQTHNGRIEVDSAGGLLDAETHNGAIEARYHGNSLQLQSHNGEINADLSRCTRLAGEVETHNGAITVSLSKNLESSLLCETGNGAIRSDLPFEGKIISTARNRLEVRGNDTLLTASTHNGSIQVRGQTASEAASR